MNKKFRRRPDVREENQKNIRRESLLLQLFLIFLRLRQSKLKIDKKEYPQIEAHSISSLVLPRALFVQSHYRYQGIF